jgi:hypothetical protein
MMIRKAWPSSRGWSTNWNKPWPYTWLWPWNKTESGSWYRSRCRDQDKSGVWSMSKTWSKCWSRWLWWNDD